MPAARTPVTTWLAAVRPGFLVITLASAMLGVVVAWSCGCGRDLPAAAATVLLALLAHAAVNLYNDYGDAVGGSDAVNHARIAPFTGGSRLVQDGVLGAAQMREAAQMLAIVVVGGGVWLAARAGPGLLAVGIAGLALGWAYSSPRVALMARGWGEVAVAAGWWLVVVGADFVQRQRFDAIPAVAAVSPALLVAAVLWVAEFPDAEADARVGKRTLVVRLGPDAAAWTYVALVAAAHLWAWAWWRALWLPTQAGWALASALPAAGASAWLLAHRRTPSRLRPVIVLTLVAAVLHPLLLGVAFVAVAALR